MHQPTYLEKGLNGLWCDQQVAGCQHKHEVVVKPGTKNKDNNGIAQHQQQPCVPPCVHQHACACKVASWSGIQCAGRMHDDSLILTAHLLYTICTFWVLNVSTENPDVSLYVEMEHNSPTVGKEGVWMSPCVLTKSVRPPSSSTHSTCGIPDRAKTAVRALALSV